MILKPQLRNDLRSEVMRERGQSTEEFKPTPPTRSKRPSIPYETFLRKFNDFENSVESFGTRDLVYYFREIAEDNGHKYVISNIKKDMAIMKRLTANYSNAEICGMIEFLYESDQDYLDKNRLSINLLASQWINTIYADMQMWVEDKYVPKSKVVSSKRKKSQHEWESSNSKSSVGKWDV